MKDTVIVFARAPRLGAVKRRLARDIGDRAALRFHLATLIRLLRALAADRRFRTVLAITPDHARFRLPVRVARMAQGGGDLGVRMHRAFRRFPRARVALIGCDIPDAGPPTRGPRSARSAARRRRSGRRRTAAIGWWRCRRVARRGRSPRVRWSTEHALADTLANFAGRRVALLRTLHDVDTADDWRRLRSSGEALAVVARRHGQQAQEAAPHRLLRAEAAAPRHVLDRAPRRAQRLARRLHPQPLHGARRRDAGRRMVVPGEAPLAHAGARGQSRHRKIAAQVAAIQSCSASKSAFRRQARAPR